MWHDVETVFDPSNLSKRGYEVSLCTQAYTVRNEHAHVAKVLSSPLGIPPASPRPLSPQVVNYFNLIASPPATIPNSDLSAMHADPQTASPPRPRMSKLVPVAGVATPLPSRLQQEALQCDSGSPAGCLPVVQRGAPLLLEEDDVSSESTQRGTHPVQRSLEPSFTPAAGHRDVHIEVDDLRRQLSDRDDCLATLRSRLAIQEDELAVCRREALRRQLRDESDHHASGSDRGSFGETVPVGDVEPLRRLLQQKDDDFQSLMRVYDTDKEKWEAERAALQMQVVGSVGAAHAHEAHATALQAAAAVGDCQQEELSCRLALQQAECSAVVALLMLRPGPSNDATASAALREVAGMRECVHALQGECRSAVMRAEQAEATAHKLARERLSWEADRGSWQRERDLWREERLLWDEERRRALEEKRQLLGEKRDWMEEAERSRRMSDDRSYVSADALSEPSSRLSQAKQRLQNMRERRAAAEHVDSHPSSQSLGSRMTDGRSVSTAGHLVVPPGTGTSSRAPTPLNSTHSMSTLRTSPRSTPMTSAESSREPTPRSTYVHELSVPVSSECSDRPWEPHQAPPPQRVQPGKLDLSKVRWGGSTPTDEHFMTQGALFMTDRADRNHGGWTKYYLTLSSVELSKDSLQPLQLSATYTKGDLQKLLSDDKLRFVRVLNPEELQGWVTDWPWHEQRAYDQRDSLREQWGKLRPYPSTLLVVPSSSLVAVTSSTFEPHEHCSLALP